MTGFVIYSNKPGRMQVAYDCLNKLAVYENDQEYRETDWTKAGEDLTIQHLSAESLKHLWVQCPEEYGLKGWKLITKCDAPWYSIDKRCDIKFTYHCVGIKSTNKIYGETGMNLGGDGRNIDLVVAPLSSGNTNALGGFNLKTDYYWRFNILAGRSFGWKYVYYTLRDVEGEKQKYEAAVASNGNYSPF